MATELSRLLEQEAKAQKDKALADARVRADEILAAARRDADVFVEEAHRRFETERAQEVARATSTASLRAAALVLAAKDETIRAVFDRASAELRGAAADPTRRRAMIRTFLSEAARDLGGGRAVAEVSAGDADGARDAARELGLDLEVRESNDLADGVRLTSSDGRSAVENTLEGRLTRARREFVSRVAEVLWGA